MEKQVGEYIEKQEPPQKEILQKEREIFKKNLPNCEEKKHMISQTGARGLDTRFVDLDKIQVYFKIDFIDRKFGTGTVYALTSGFGTSINFPPTPYGGAFSALKDSYELQRILQEAVMKARLLDTPKL